MTHFIIALLFSLGISATSINGDNLSTPTPPTDQNDSDDPSDDDGGIIIIDILEG